MLTETRAAFLFPDSGGKKPKAWFDPLDYHTESIRHMAACIERMIDEVVARGTPAQRIFLGGYENGGAAAIQAGLVSKYVLGGVFGLCSALPDDPQVDRDLSLVDTTASPSVTTTCTPKGHAPPTRQPPQVLLCCGRGDATCDAVTRTSQRLRKLGATVDLELFGHLRSGLGDGVIRALAGWINNKLMV